MTASAPPPMAVPHCTPQTCKHPKAHIITDLDEIVRLLKQTPIASVDVETTDFSPFKGRIECLSYAVSEDTALWVPFIGDGAVPMHRAIEKLRPLHEDPDREWIEHNGKFDNKHKWKSGLLGHPLLTYLMPRGKVIDTCIASRLLDENLQSQRLKDIIKMPDYGFGHLMMTYKEVKELRAPQQDLFKSAAQVFEEFKSYSCEDAVWTLRLWFKKLKPLIDAEPKIAKIFYQLECRVLRGLTDMELRGVAIDIPYLDELQRYFTEITTTLEKEIYKLAEREFDIGSHEQVSRLLFDELQIGERGELKRNKGQHGKKDWISTDEGVLEKYTDIPIVEKIMRWGNYAKLRNTYTHPLGELAREVDGRVRSSFNQVPNDRGKGESAVTGRLSSSEPNLQNIPIRTEEGRKIRKAFIASKDKPKKRQFIVGDYSQIELRFLAHFTQDRELMRAYRKWDCHECKGSGFTNKPLHNCPKCGAKDGKRDKKNPKQPTLSGFCLGLDLHTITAMACGVERDAGKVINFALDFGMGKQKFSLALKMPRSQSDPIRDAYFKKYAGVWDWFETIPPQLRKHGYVTTILGRKRRFPQCIRQRVDMFGREWRQAANAIIQGSAADLMKCGMRNLYEGLEAKGWLEHTYPVLTVHDEFVIETDEERVPEVLPYMQERLETPFEIDVPILVSMGSGPTWGDAKG